MVAGGRGSTRTGPPKTSWLHELWFGQLRLINYTPEIVCKGSSKEGDGGDSDDAAEEFLHDMRDDTRARS